MQLPDDSGVEIMKIRFFSLFPENKVGEIPLDSATGIVNFKNYLYLLLLPCIIMLEIIFQKYFQLVKKGCFS